MKKFLILGCSIFVVSCGSTIQSQTSCNQICTPIYGHEEDWNLISDDLARNIYRHNLLCKELKE
ncbi:MAG TPA: hypothetical protein IAC63_03940 [Candidatus Enterousia avicola]|uniref:Lipoprotein n=1 Tax=Candidatus Enterousia avicola TaxID=2840787 RepID=A0A9D1MTE5_9PROT|nr:hypothetical protein [Candidatus Enterousia avicola]